MEPDRLVTPCKKKQQSVGAPSSATSTITSPFSPAGGTVAAFGGGAASFASAWPGVGASEGLPPPFPPVGGFVPDLEVALAAAAELPSGDGSISSEGVPLPFSPA